MTINRIVQQSAKRAHITAIKSGMRAAKRIDERAAKVKAAMRILAANKKDIDTATARRMFDQLTAEAEKLIRDVIRFQASDSYKAMAKSLTATVPGAVTPDLEVPTAAEQAERDKLGVPNYMGSVGAIAAVLLLAMASLRHSGQMSEAALTRQAETAIDRLSNRARAVVKAQTLAASNRAIIAAVENTYQVPVARRVANARLRRSPVIVPVLPDDGKFLRVRFALPASPGLERGQGGNEVLHPKSLGPLTPTVSTSATRDPNPPRRTRAMTALIGWQVISMLDNRVRPKHMIRHGMKYYYDPGPDERGLDEMPNPPYESPKDGGSMAYNCRCVLVPLIEES